MELQPDFVIEKDKKRPLPPSCNFALIINNLPFSIGVEINHNKFQQPTITLLPVMEKENRG